jgi:hypothetical protein
MRQTFLSKLRANGVYYLVGSLLLLPGVPLYQVAILNPQGYSSALAATGGGHFATYLSWISHHTASFLIYRLLLVIAFACLWSLPFTLFRIIVAQEILGPEDEEVYEDEEENEDEGEEEEDEGEGEEAAGMPADAWRGKGFAVLAAWSGLIGIVLFALATLASTIYLAVVSFTAASAPPNGFSTLSGLFTILTYTVGGGLLGLSCLLFGIVIARAGLRLWPGLWVAFGYAALLLTAFLISSAVGVATVSNESQSIFTTPAILLFALWTFWFGLMLVRLKPATA